jgi:hypothetical protein
VCFPPPVSSPRYEAAGETEINRSAFRELFVSVVPEGRAAVWAVFHASPPPVNFVANPVFDFDVEAIFEVASDTGGMFSAAQFGA